MYSKCCPKADNSSCPKAAIVKDLLRNQTAKFKPDVALVKSLKSQQIFINDNKYYCMKI